ncbi:MAG TPA: cupin domain-containing protein [Acetobacteraceae bacterium]|nr:cupin domain-containing protein [Acetobacteraceae bacterium]
MINRSKIIKRIASAALIAAASFSAGVLWAQKAAKPPLDSHIWSAADTRTSNGDWGEIHLYTEDAQPSYGNSSVLTASLTFLPGKRLQPPHQHPDEEFQYVIEGEGTWFLNGKEQPLHAGDLMYSKPWDWHGIRNSSDKPMRFFVFKFRSRGVPDPAKPPEPTTN